MTDRVEFAAGARRAATAATDAAVAAASPATSRLADAKELASGLAIGACIGVGVVLLKMAWEQRSELREVKEALFVLKQSDAVRAQRELLRVDQVAHVAPPALPTFNTRAVGRPTASQLASHQQLQQQMQHQQQQQQAAGPPSAQPVPPPMLAPLARSDGAQACEPVNPRLELAADPR